LTCYVDSDCAGDLDSRKSTTGYVLFLSGTQITWKPTKQSIVAASAVEAEFVAASMAVNEVMWARQLLAEIGYAQTDETRVHADNQGAIRLIINPKETHACTKHIYIPHMLIRHHQQTRGIAVC